MLRARVRAAGAAVAVAGCLAAPASAGAQGQTGGSPLDQLPNTFGCETKPTFTEQSSDGNYRFLGSGPPDCTWFSTGVVGAPSQRTGAVPGDGRITSVTVRGGPSPAVLRFVILRLFADSASGSRQCCFFVAESPPVQPAPSEDGVSTFAVDLPVERNTNPFNGLVTQDFVGVSAVTGTGSLPLFSNGFHNTLTDYQNGKTAAGFLYPRLGGQPGDGGGGRREESIPGMEVLLQWTWTPPGGAPGGDAPGGGGGAGPPAGGDGGGGGATGSGSGAGGSGGGGSAGGGSGGTGGGGSGGPASGSRPASLLGSSTLRARDGVVALRVRCRR